ncbi:hypothetical protein X946_5579 [Burkholderia sp. ABCPW 111]|nr:hypothetical protein X946_5579 [Burkholderia sp. ABCPW 111]
MHLRLHLHLHLHAQKQRQRHRTFPIACEATRACVTENTAFEFGTTHHQPIRHSRAPNAHAGAHDPRRHAMRPKQPAPARGAPFPNARNPPRPTQQKMPSRPVETPHPYACAPQLDARVNRPIGSMASHVLFEREPAPP